MTSSIWPITIITLLVIAIVIAGVSIYSEKRILKLVKDKPLEVMALAVSVIGIIGALILAPIISTDLQSAITENQNKTKLGIACNKKAEVHDILVKDTYYFLVRCTVTNLGNTKLTLSNVNPIYYSKIGDEPYVPNEFPSTYDDIAKINDEIYSKVLDLRKDLPKTLDKSEQYTLMAILQIPFDTLNDYKNKGLEACEYGKLVLDEVRKTQSCIEEKIKKPISNYLYEGANYQWSYLQGIGLRATASDGTISDTEFKLIESQFSYQEVEDNPRLTSYPESIGCWKYGYSEVKNENGGSSRSWTSICGFWNKAAFIATPILALIFTIYIITRIIKWILRRIKK